MASTKYKMRYGQYTSEVARQLSVDYLGTVVYSGKTKEIWIDGKCIAANFQGGIDDLKETIGVLNNLTTTDKTSLVNAINSIVTRLDNTTNTDINTAEITTENGASTLTIFGVKQTEGAVENDANKDFSVKIEGEYSVSNPLVTKVYVDNAINSVLGSDQLEKTLDTIKEIQEELLKDVKYTVVLTDGSDEIEIEVTRVVDEETGEITYVDDDDNIVATETEDGEIEYEEGYSDLNRESAIDALMSNVNDNKENIENIENKNLVSNVVVDENTVKNFVTAEAEQESDEFGLNTKSYTIGVEYGTFKTGHGNVMDPTSEAYVDGIATVKDVQDYVEERLTWDEFVTSANDITDAIENSSETEYNVPNNSEIDEPIVIKDQD